MPIIYSPALPPIPAGLSASDLAILREEGWGEDTVQTLINKLRVNTPSTRVPCNTVDLRDYLTDAQNATYEAGGAVNATSAMQTILSAVSRPPGGSAATDLLIRVPGSGQMFTIDSTVTYYGANGVGLAIQGGHGLGRGGTYGSGFKWTGAEGGTMFDLQGFNGGVIENLFFDGGNKAKYLLRIREQTSAPDVLVMPSSGIKVYRCFFAEPTLLDPDSALVAVGRDDNLVSTLQASEHYFQDCYFQGCNETGRQGYGFRALESGNTKNHVFTNCVFTQLYRGVHAQSGMAYLIGCIAGNIGYDADSEAAFAYAAGNCLVMICCGMESGGPGYMSRFAKAGQPTTLEIIGGYCALATPPDDIAIVGTAKMAVRGLGLEGNGRSATGNLISWAANTVMRVGQQRLNGTRVYKVVSVISDAKTAGAGGPIGTGTGIVDHNVTWDYAGPAEGNVLGIRASSVESASGTGWGGVTIENCPFQYMSTPITDVPLYDGSSNLLNSTADYPKIAGHKVNVRGCATGASGGSINVPLPEFSGDRVPCLLDTALVEAITSGVTVVKNDSGSFCCDVPYTLLKTNQAPVLCRLPEGVIFSVQAKVTQAVLGVTNPAFSIGRNAGGGLDDDSLILSKAATATDKFGDDDADLGVDLAKSVGGTPVRTLCSTSSNYDYIQLTLTKTAGSFSSLSAGNIRVEIEWRKFG